MKQIAFILMAVFATMTITKTNAQTGKQTAAAIIQVIQFHSEHRCVTCMKIETLTKATLAKSFPSIPFKLYNVDDKANVKFAEQFEATGTALFLYNPKTGKKKDLTDFAFMKAGDEMKFEAELKKYIEDFIKG
ncbi:nitrophenyl compound nitroreductase subunit ArsF family protein [Flavihumibacter stibioxidans]|uniref:Thioredoxin domain-containing protein n=1 Tax=Flavihumibacter stibioxidans TaxID=1834163 RepID=A0ABR7M5W9_9BACT|nr:nitrophenyl compound nitroreductase subunit ArsF family protein [Flavihumibacter stibioxidans]MBC6490414.1 hypothetical protein [Flavihumibacter stibioxidans]